MRAISSLLAVVVVLCCSAVSRAVTIRVQDPNFTNITTTPTSFLFSACPGANSPGGPYLDNGVPISADGCFGGLNQSQAIITSLTLSFQNTTAVQNSTAPDAAFSDVFRTASFTAPADRSDPNAFYTFTFTGGGLNQREAFVITEDGVPPGDFPTVTLSFTTNAATPEPSSVLLLGTSLVCMGCLSLRHRYV